MQRILLNGTWNLCGKDRLSGDKFTIAATVPGNVELDLQKAGYLPQDLFFDSNILLAEKYETYDYIYERQFDCPHPEKRHRLIFLGVDCVAEYYVNGQKIGQSDNMLVEHVFPVSGLKATGNTLTVKIFSTYLYCNQQALTLRQLATNWGANMPEPSVLRRAAHTYGWDIMPRAVSAGIWKDVYLEQIPDYEFTQLYFATQALTKDSANLFLAYELPTGAIIRREHDFCLRVTGVCKGSRFEKIFAIRYRAGSLRFSIDNPMLWWPVGFGEPNLYTVCVTLMQGENELCSKTLKMGIKTVHLNRTDVTDGINGKFEFIVNGEPCFIRGTNWVPLSPYHSQDSARLPQALALLKESGANMARCWGGNVYESEQFYDFLDENGILCWQDFAFGCTFFPNDERLFSQVKAEATKVIKRLRGHACLALWAGDNEHDIMHLDSNMNPESNLLNRKILAECVAEHDWFHDYLPSSPYVSPSHLQGKGDMPENHLWGQRDFYKSAYYAQTKAHFISEIGHPGCVCKQSALRFMPESELNNRHGKTWVFHSADQKNDDYRIHFLEKNVKTLFGALPQNFDAFSRASQIAHAEASKYFIEHMRAQKPIKSGVLLWNLLDGWPQSTEATIDFYFTKKLAFDVVKRASQPFALLMDTDQNGIPQLFAVNDTRTSQTVTYAVTDGETGELLAQGNTQVSANGIRTLQSFADLISQKRLLVLRWSGDSTGCNHFLTGNPTYSLPQVDKWYQNIQSL